jgi:hypothetical protein
MFFTGESLARIYRDEKRPYPSQALINSPRIETIDRIECSFDPITMITWNVSCWDGFYPADFDFENLILMYGLGFCKRFWPNNDPKAGAGS